MANPYGRKGKKGAFVECIIYEIFGFIIFLGLFISTLKWYFLLVPALIILLNIWYFSSGNSKTKKSI